METKNKFSSPPVRPLHDWRMLLMLFFAGVCISGALHYEIFLWLKDKSVPTDYSTTGPRLDEKKLKMVTDLVLTREQNFQTLTETKPTVADPSIP